MSHSLVNVTVSLRNKNYVEKSANYAQHFMDYVRSFANYASHFSPLSLLF